MTLTRSLTSALATILAASLASAQPVDWIRQLGTLGDDYARGIARIGADLIVAGSSDRALGGQTFLRDDVWFARYDSAGNQLWIRQFGSTGVEIPNGIAMDGTGGFFAVGRTSAGFGGNQPIGAAEGDVWVGRFTGDGDPLWIRLYGTTQTDNASDCLAAPGGGLYVGGRTQGRLGLPPSFGDYDGFVTRFDGDGNQLWALQMGTSGFNAIYALAPDAEGGVYAAGETAHVPGGNEDGWLTRIDQNGNRRWTRHIGSNREDSAEGVAPDGAGGVYVGGSTLGEIASPRLGQTDAWLAHFASDGEMSWVIQFGTCDTDHVSTIASDGAGGALVAGLTTGDFRTAQAGGDDAWIAHIDSTGRVLAVRQFGSNQRESIFQMIDDGDAVLAVGYTNGSLGGPSAGDADAWLGRFTKTCYANCDENGRLDIFDFLCFQDAFAAGSPRADCNGDCAADIFDFLCFQDAFTTGCP